MVYPPSFFDSSGFGAICMQSRVHNPNLPKCYMQ